MQRSAAAIPEVLAEDRGDGVARGRDIAPWALALVLAGLGTGMDFDAQPGVNWGIWTTIAAVGLLWIGRRRARAQARDAQAAGRVDPVAVWAAGLAILVAWGAAVTENDLFQFLIVVTCATLLAVATRVLAGMSGREVGIGVVAGAPLSACSMATVEAGRRAVAAIARARDGRRTALVRGILLALPVAVVFALVLAGADPMLTVLRDRSWDALTQAISIPKVMFFLGLGTLALGAYGLATRATGERPARPLSDTRAVFGATERRVIVGAVVGVFGAFLALQATYLFRDVGALRVSGMTYAEYAHQGFVELAIAATLAVGLVVGLDHWGPRDRDACESSRWRRWGTLLLIAEVLIVLASAFHRLTLYESAYGYTMLRLYVQAYGDGRGNHTRNVGGRGCPAWGCLRCAAGGPTDRCRSGGVPGRGLIHKPRSLGGPPGRRALLRDGQVGHAIPRGPVAQCRASTCGSGIDIATGVCGVRAARPGRRASGAGAAPGVRALVRMESAACARACRAGCGRGAPAGRTGDGRLLPRRTPSFGLMRRARRAPSTGHPGVDRHVGWLCQGRCLSLELLDERRFGNGVVALRYAIRT